MFEDKRNEITTTAIIAFIFVGLFIIFVFPPSSADDIIIINGGGGGNATTGVTSLDNGNNGLALNQTTGNIMINNTMFAFNLGGGVELVFNAGPIEAGEPIGIKSLTSGDNIIITDLGIDGIMINATDSSDSTICGNVGTGNKIHKIGTNCNANSLIAGVGISITNTTDDWTFASQCANTGTGEAICETANNINSLIAGNGIAISDTTGDLTIGLITPNKWEQLCQTTLGATATSISCNIADRNHLFVTCDCLTLTNTLVAGIQFNNDTGANYAHRSSLNGGAQVTGVSVAQINIQGATTIATGDRGMIKFDINNPSVSRKSVIGDATFGYNTGAGTAPSSIVFSGKWSNTSDAITTITINRVSGTGVFDVNTQLTVWGYD